jgi:hypothetical protein
MGGALVLRSDVLLLHRTRAAAAAPSAHGPNTASFFSFFRKSTARC